MTNWKTRGSLEIIFLIGIVLISVFISGGIFTKSTVQLTPNSNNAVNVDQANNSTSSASQNLQLQTFTAATPAPIANTTVTCGNGTAPQIDNNYTGPYFVSTCSDGCVFDGVNTGAGCCPGVSNQPGPNGVDWCDAKPVIYLYPEKVTSVSVKVEIPGRITVSIPTYNNGWNVTAYPDGTLVSNGQKYSELFYETSQAAGTPPSKGFVVKKSDLQTKLIEITTNLGLSTKEQSEFMDYWLPRLNTLNKPYYFVSFFENKDEVDKVTITPTPDNFIGFIMYFKGLNKNTKVQTPSYPSVPQRTGFTAVEWGGIVE